jgi:voltage-gated sodium channel
MLRLIKQINASPHFFDAVLILLVIAALSMGAEATPSMEEAYGNLIAVTLTVIQVAFVIEILLRITAYWPRPQDFFHRGWNSFDFIVVALSLLPAIGSLGLVARLLRLARLVRIVSVSGALRNFASGRLHGTSAVISAVMTLGLLWYVMALAGYYLFSASGNGHWGSMAGGLTHVGQLLLVQHITAVFSGTDVVVARTYLAVLYLGELAIFLEMVSQLLRAAKPRRADAV